MDKRNSVRYILAVTMLLLLASAAINIVLARKLAVTNEKLAAVESERVLPIGARIDSIAAKELNGGAVSVDLSSSDSPTVLYIFSPACRWCVRNSDNVKELVRQKGDQFRFVGLSISNQDLADFVNEHEMNFPVLVEPTEETARTLKIGATPQTIVMSREGEVLKNWSGAYSNLLRDEVEQYFQVTLPGIGK